MAAFWDEHIRKTGQLAVYNTDKSWANVVDAAMKIVNDLSFGVELVKASDEGSANIGVVVATGPTSKTFESAYYRKITARTRPEFDPKKLHGQTSAVSDAKSKEIVYSVVFLPGSVPQVTKSQRVVVAVHELIHACGMDEHDDRGIMYPIMIPDGTGLIEQLHDKTATSMPPIRVGPKTSCIMKMLWAGGKSC